jgi:hypothetical protein
MKKCFKCGEIKFLADFYAHKKMADGHLGKCKDCTKSDVRQHRAENDSVREYDRERSKTPARRAHVAMVSKKWRLENPQGYKAHTALGNAVRDKKIIRMPCEVCGNKRSHAHHDDYSKPLEVSWLCALHHHRLHAEAK